MNLSDFGVLPETFIPTEPLCLTCPTCILIKECETWEEVREILIQNKKTHPDDRVWIGFDGKKCVFQVGREKIK